MCLIAPGLSERLYLVAYSSTNFQFIFMFGAKTSWNGQYKNSIKIAPPPQYFYTDRSKAVLLLWFLTVTCSCCPYLYFGSAIMLVTYFVNFR